MHIFRTNVDCHGLWSCMHT